MIRSALFLALALVAAPAGASGICDVDTGDERDDDIVVNTDVIVPCAMVESGFFGPACQDAPVYVVTHAGVVLCQVNLAVVASQGSTPIVSSRPAAPAAPAPFAHAPPALLAALPALPSQCEGDCAAIPHRALRGPPDVPPQAPWGPS